MSILSPSKTEEGLSTPPTLRVPLLLLALGVVIPATYYIASAIYSSQFLADDFYISLRYARNFASGQGIVYNIGETFPRSEGYTNFLVVLIQAFLFKVGLNSFLAPITWLRAIAAASMVAAIGMIGYYCYQRLKDKGSSFSINSILLISATSLLAATATPLIFWSVSGMETGLFAALTTTAVVLYGLSFSQSRVSLAYLSNVFFLLATLTRPEGLLFWGVVLLFEIGRYGLSRRVHFDGYVWQRQRSYSFFIFIAGIAVHWIWKLSYYGDILPLTYYAKQTAVAALADKPQIVVSHRLIGGLFRFVELLSVDYNYLIVAGLAAGSLGLWKASMWKRLFGRHSRIAGSAVLIGGILFLTVLLSRSSQEPVILGRYSMLYFLIIIQAIGLVFFGMMALLFVIWENRRNDTTDKESKTSYRHVSSVADSHNPSGFNSKRRFSAPLIYLSLISILYVAWIITNGSLIPLDDNFRLYAPILPIFALLAFEIMRRLEPTSVMIVSTLIIGLCAFRVLFLVYANEVDMNYTYSNRWKGKGISSARHFGNGIAAWEDLGKWLNRYADPQDALAVDDAGSIPYLSRLRTIDTWSLNDRTIVKLRAQLVDATSKEESTAIETALSNYIWQQNPRFFMYTSPQARPLIVEDRRFVGNYCRVDLDRYIPGITDRMIEVSMEHKLYMRSHGVGLTTSGEIPFCVE